MNSYDNLLEAFKNIKAQEQEELEYRVHYNEQGFIYMCSMQAHPDNTNYLVVTKDEYDNYMRYQVKDNQLVKIDRTRKHRVQLKSSDHGYTVVRNHAGIILESTDEYKDIEHYENN